MLKTSNNIIEESFYCHDISLSLGGRNILNDVKLKVNPGQILGLVGLMEQEKRHFLKSYVEDTSLLKAR